MQEYIKPTDLKALRSLLICATIEELPNNVGQPVAWSEPVVLMLIVRRAHQAPPAESVCGVSIGSVHGQEQSVWLQ